MKFLKTVLTLPRTLIVSVIGVATFFFPHAAEPLLLSGMAVSIAMVADAVAGRSRIEGVTRVLTARLEKMEESK